MQELIRISEQNGHKVVSARDLHSFLTLKSKFADWFKNRIKKYGFEDGIDFISVSKNLENGGRELDYGLTLDTAKELAMVEGNAKGKEARQYFIECEKQLKQTLQVLPKSQSELILMIAQQNVLTESRLTSLEEQVKEVAAKQIGTTTDYYSVAGFSSLRSQPIDIATASGLSKRCHTLCKELGYERHTIPDPRFGKVFIYPKTVLETVFNQHYPLMKRA